MDKPHLRHRAYTADSQAKPRRAAQLQQAIEAIVKEIPRGTHLTAPEVYRRAREQGLQISLSTVYRCLNQLQAGGNVSTVSGDHGRRYEARDDDHDHDHLICLKCGLTVEFTDELIRGFGRTLAERKGYELSHSRFDILGICSTCKAQDEDHKIAGSIGVLETCMRTLTTCSAKIEMAIALLEARKLVKANELVGELLKELDQAHAQADEASGILGTQN